MFEAASNESLQDIFIISFHCPNLQRAKLKNKNVSQCDKCQSKTWFSRMETIGQCHSDPKTVLDTPGPQGASTHQIRDSNLK